MTSEIDHVLDSIRSIGDLDAARAAVAGSGHGGEVRLRSTPIGYVWAPTEAEWEAAARRHEARRRRPEALL
jgi:formylglycine-generating enzyme required for sulfatase activity